MLPRMNGLVSAVFPPAPPLVFPPSPLGGKVVNVATLSTWVAHRTFHRIYKRSNPINILEQPDFHPLSVTLPATVTQQDE